jgi:hypothetical protein
MSARPNIAPNSFLNGQNYQKLVGFLRNHYTSKLGMSALPERVDTRLQKTVQHFMTEVARMQGSRATPVQLNQEVVRETTSSIDLWLKKQEAAARPTTTTLGAFTKPPTVPIPTPAVQDDYSRLFEDTGARFESVMSERTQPANTFAQSLPDFRMQQNELESNEDPVILVQRMQKAREDQARAMGIQAGAGAGAQQPTAAVTQPRLEIKDDIPSAMRPIPPQADNPPPLLAPRQQDYIIPQESIQKYQETEYNIFLTSGDRDWLRNTSENRYNFSVNFNTGTKKNGFSFNASLQERFRNIQRIEFVKAIVPLEAYSPLVRVVDNDPAVVYDTTRVVNIFSLPFVGVRIAELNNNGFSTKPEEDNTFAIVQYDTTWSSDLLAQSVPGTAPTPVLTKSGFTGLIPKFLKTQKVYTPAPLATLQRMTIRMERHNGELLSGDSDVHFFKRICMSNSLLSIGVPTGTVYGISSPQNAYIFIQTSKFFPYSAVSEGDTIQIQGYTPATTSATATDFANYINRSQGHTVIATAYVSGAGVITDGRNDAGYCNVIIIRSRFDDPTTGSTGRTASYFGGGDGTAETAFSLDLDNAVVEPNQTGAALLNTSRQTHIVIRIITRDYDSSSNMRPDNV